MDQESYGPLRDFIDNQMSMSHIYQPVMLKALLKGDKNGVHKRDIARAILAYDDSQVGYVPEADILTYLFREIRSK